MGEGRDKLWIHLINGSCNEIKGCGGLSQEKHLGKTRNRRQELLRRENAQDLVDD